MLRFAALFVAGVALAGCAPEREVNPGLKIGEEGRLVVDENAEESGPSLGDAYEFMSEPTGLYSTWWYFIR